MEDRLVPSTVLPDHSFPIAAVIVGMAAPRCSNLRAGGFFRVLKSSMKFAALALVSCLRVAGMTSSAHAQWPYTPYGPYGFKGVCHGLSSEIGNA